MKKTLLAALLLLCFVLTACDRSTIITETSDGTLWVKATDEVYVPCSVSLKAYSIDKSEVYYKTRDNNKYYRIRFQDPKEFVSEADNVMGGVYRLSTLPEITLESFGAIAAQVYIVSVAEYVVDQFSAAREYIEDTSFDFTNYSDGSEYTNAVVNAMLHDEHTEVPEYIDQEETRRIRLLSNQYPGLMYEIIFMKSVNGKSYLYDRGTGICVLAPQIIVDRLI